MSNYDDWKLEAWEDREARMGTHQRGAASDAYGGVCACGTETTRSVSQRHGFIWQCSKCAESAIRAIYDRAARKIG